MAVTDYASIRTELNNYTERSYTQDQVDTFIGLFEAKANTRLGPTFRRDDTTTLTTDANGEATLPTGLGAIRSLVRDVSGSVPLHPVAWGSISILNPYLDSDEPTHFAVSGTTLKVAPIAADDFILTHRSRLTALSGSNTTNWLLTTAPHVYFLGVQAEAKAFEEEWPTAQALEATALSMLADLVADDVVTQYSAAEMVMDTVTP